MKKKEVDALFEEWMKDAPSDESIRRSAASREVNARPMSKARKSNTLKSTFARPEVKQRASDASKEVHARPEVKAQRTATLNDTNKLTEVKERRSANAKRINTDPDYKRRQVASLRFTLSLPEVKAKRSAAYSGLVCWNNGVRSTKSRECPGLGWSRGRLPHKPK